MTGKIIFLLLFALMCPLVSAQEKINILAENINIEQAFGQIEKQTSYSIAFNRTQLDVSRRLSLSLKNADIGETLSKILKGTSFTYKINGNHIIIVVDTTSTTTRIQQSFSVSGYVKDAETGETLIGCHLMDSVTNKGVTTNTFGYFVLMQNTGHCVFTAFYMGYHNQSVHLNITKDTTFVIFLKPKQFNIGEVVVRGSKSVSENKLSNPQMSVMNLNSKEIKKMPLLLGEADVMRAIQVLPGIQAANERSTGISVRGGSIDQNLFLLDDAPIFQISHLMGFSSVFNNDAVKDIRIYKGDIPANYGGRLSSVVDIRLKDGNMQNYSVAGGIGLTAANLSVEGPIIKDRVSFIVSGKYAYIGQLYRLIQDIDITFYDLNVKLNAMINPKSRIYFSSYNGGDNDGILRSKYRNNTLSLRWNYVYNPKLFSNISLIYSNYHLKSENQPNKKDENYYSWRSGIGQLTLKTEYNYFINNNNTLDFGASFSYSEFVPGKLEGNERIKNNATQSIPFSNRIVENQGVLDYAMYVSNQQKVTDNLSLKYGIRASLYQSLGGHWVYPMDDNYQVADSFYVSKTATYADYFSIEPRASLNYRIFRHSAIKASYTYTTQQTQLLVKTNGGGPMDIWFPSGVNIKPQTASQYSLGWVQYAFKNSWEASIEGYYKKMNHIIDYKDGANLLGQTSVYIDKTSYHFEEQLRAGQGYAYGMELMFKGEVGKFDGFVSYTYARSKRKIPDINNGETYLSPFDKPHTFNLFLNCNMTKRWSVSANFRRQSGQVTTLPVYAMEVYGRPLLGYSNRNEYRLPYYQRLDLSITRKNKEKPNKKWHSEWNLSVINVLNRANLSYVNFTITESSPNIIEAKGVYMLGFLPSISYRFNF